MNYYGSFQEVKRIKQLENDRKSKTFVKNKCNRPRKKGKK